MSLSREDVEDRVLAFARPHLVISGGEPLLQQRELAPLAASLQSRGFYSEVETNGTLAPLPEMVEGISQWNVSPKTANSGNSRDRPGELRSARGVCSAGQRLLQVRRRRAGGRRRGLPPLGRLRCPARKGAAHAGGRYGGRGPRARQVASRGMYTARVPLHDPAPHPALGRPARPLRRGREAGIRPSK